MTTRLTLTEPRTDPELLALIEKARNHVMTPEEVEAQRISWVIGQMGMTHPEWTREETEARVREALRLPPAGAPTRADLEAEVTKLKNDCDALRRANDAYTYLGADGRVTTGRAIEDRAATAEHEVARLREWCSAAADDLESLLAAMKAGVGPRFDDIFRRTAEEFTETSAFLRAAAEGRADGTLYEAELTKAKNERDAARAAVAQMREDCARAAERFAPATSGPDYGMASDAERREAREAERFAFAIADAIRDIPLPTADCRLPRSEGAPSP